MFFRRALIVFLLLALMGGALTVFAQGDGSDWRIVEARPVTLPDGGRRLPPVIPAPDGRHFAYENDGQACAFDAVTDEETCLTVSEDVAHALGYEPSYPSAVWSGDSTKLAWVGQPMRFFRDTDLTIIDFAAGTVMILVDDGVEGGRLIGDEEVAGVIIDAQPAWSPDGTQIAVERTVWNAAGEMGGSTLAIIDVETGEATDLLPLPGFLNYERDFGSTTGLAWSPDSATLAATFRHPRADPDWDGLWLFPVDGSGGRRIVSWDEVATALAAFFNVPAGEESRPLFDVLNLPTWSPDGSRLLFWGISGAASAQGQGLLWVELESEVITVAPVPDHPDNEPRRRMISPLYAAWSPDGGSLLVATMEVAPHPDEDIQSLDPDDDDARVGVRLIDVATLEGMLLGHLPRTVSAAYFGAWGAENNVFIGGYHLTMAQD